MTDGPRVAVIGLDCAPAKLVFGDLLDEIPNIRKLMESGMHGDLASITPPITVPAWACSMSGNTPGQLGIYGFRGVMLARSQIGRAHLNSSHPSISYAVFC